MHVVVAAMHGYFGRELRVRAVYVEEKSKEGEKE